MSSFNLQQYVISATRMSSPESKGNIYHTGCQSLIPNTWKILLINHIAPECALELPLSLQRSRQSAPIDQSGHRG